MQERTPAAAPIYTGFEEITEPAAQLPQPAEQDAVMGDVAERAPRLPPGAEPDAILGEVMEREPRPPQDAEQDAVTGDVVERLSTQQPQRGTHGRVTFADNVRGGDDEVCDIQANSMMPVSYQNLEDNMGCCDRLLAAAALANWPGVQ